MSDAEKLSMELPVYLFHQGTNYYAYDFLGAHSYSTEDGQYETVFRVWAPRAESVSVTGDFCGWDKKVEMSESESSGIWQVEIKTKKKLNGSRYKYSITGKNGTHLKADPYALYDETLMNTASVVWETDGFEWSDSQWLADRKSILNKCSEDHFYSAPLNIYEMHLGSWKTVDGECTSDGNHYLNYRDIADSVAEYAKDMGYTHVELLPIMEHPYDGSWGYQVCGYYAPTSRFGTPQDFMYFVDRLHKSGIGVILDWVPAHFPKDEHGLYEFDGEPLYEYSDPFRMEHKGWGTRFFDVGKPEVISFLVSNALFWFRKYHVDGLRIDAVASMLYLDCDKAPGEWKPNKYGDNRNLEAVEFFKKLNTAVFAEFPEALMIAEESASWGTVTKPVFSGGLGFNFKWNMGWSNDLFEYVSTAPEGRKYIYNKLTFPMMYAFGENYILPVSHDEVVHGKKSLVDKMYGSYDEKFSCMRVFLMYMMTLPGKKLSFMGNEFAQFREWDYENQLEWFMLKYPRHTEMSRFVRRLNHFYLENSQLWEIDDGWDGFEWIEANQNEFNIISYRRKNIAGEELTVVLNFSPTRHNNYKIKVPQKGTYKEILTTDEYCYGGTGIVNGELKSRALYKNKNNPISGRTYIIEADLPAYGGLIFKKT